MDTWGVVAIGLLSGAGFVWLSIWLPETVASGLAGLAEPGSSLPRAVAGFLIVVTAWVGLACCVGWAAQQLIGR